MNTYFAQDGNYGNADGLAVVDTSNFTDEDWQAIDDAYDTERAEIAVSIYRNLVEHREEVK